MGYCPSCDEEFEYSSLLCPDCGERLDDETGNEADTTDGPPGDEADTDSERTRDETGDLQDSWGGPENRSVAASIDDRSDTDDGPKFISDDLVGFIFGYPKRGGWLGTLVGGITYLLGSIILIPLIYNYGYAYRIGRAAARGDSEPPKGDEWGNILVDGLVLALVYIGFIIVGMVAFFLVAMIGLIPAAAFDSAGLAFFGFLVVIAGVFAIIWFFGSMLFALVGTANVYEALSGLWFIKIGLTMEYVIVVVMFIVIQIVMVMALIATAITLIGILLWPFIFAYTIYAEFALLGYMYNKGARDGKFEPVQSGDPIDLA